MRIYLMRHGEPDFPGGRKLCLGKADIPLGLLGRLQAALLADALGGRVSRVYSSPLKRALETAGIIGRELGISPVSERALMELSFGDWEGCSWDEIGRRWPEQFAAYSADRRTYAPPNGESYAEMLGRAWPFVDALRRMPGDAAALCVCHSAVMRGLLAREQGLSVAESYKRIKLPNGALAELGSLE